MNTARVLGATVLTLLAACASQPSSPGLADQVTKTEQVCVNQPITGSHRVRRICIDKDAYDQRRRKAQDLMTRETLGRPRPKSVEGGG